MSSNTRLLQEEDEFIPGTDAQVIKDTFRVYGTLYVVMMVAFCILRKRYPRYYNVRSWAPGLDCELCHTQFGFLSWMWKVYRIPDTAILEQCGLDALCFLRVLQFGFKISCVGIFNSVWLIPMYATASSAEETQDIQDPIEELTTAHVPDGSRRLIGTVVSAYILSFAFMYFLLQELE